VTYIGHGLNPSSVELVHKFVVQPKFVELETELAVERVLLIPSLNFDGATGVNLQVSLADFFDYGVFSKLMSSASRAMTRCVSWLDVVKVDFCQMFIPFVSCICQGHIS